MTSTPAEYSQSFLEMRVFNTFIISFFNVFLIADLNRKEMTFNLIRENLALIGPISSWSQLQWSVTPPTAETIAMTFTVAVHLFIFRSTVAQAPSALLPSSRRYTKEIGSNTTRCICKFSLRCFPPPTSSAEWWPTLSSRTRTGPSTTS
ncbi:hypothetical protein, unlikely [Trypanosoma congolense IL3000]|uniref:Uncharacterized protein n=1 Tax=Trypanosoma congolense (strain IL3000) TaxID=1068625 RepID=F9W3P9_TRYCI|nr:hypothetical protein, unlikely [Trypanosoma congolense IL3000]